MKSVGSALVKRCYYNKHETNEQVEIRMKHKSTHSRKLEIFIIAASVIMFIAVAVVASVRAKNSLDENVSRRALSELKSVSADQAALIYNELSQNFQSLDYIAEYVETGSVFDDEERQSVLKAIAATSNWKTIGFADLSGDAVDYEGNPLGNVSERAYFEDIIGGSKDTVVDHIKDTNLQDRPQFIFSIPVKTGEQITGVLFASMDAGVLQNITLGDTAEDGITEIYFIDSDGLIMGVNTAGKSHVNGNNYFTDHDNGTYTGNMSEEKLKASMAESESGSYQFIHDDGTENVIYTWTGVNDWYVFAMANVDASEAKYASNMTAIRNLISNIIGAFAAVILVIVIVSAFFLRRMDKTEKRMLFEQTRNDILLRESGNEQAVYDVKAKTITGKGFLVQSHDNSVPKPLNNVMNHLKAVAPETSADLDSICAALKTVASTAEKTVIDRPMRFSGTVRWIRIVFAPFAADGKNISHVFISMIDNSYMHEQFEKSAEILKNMPGGFLRCNLEGKPLLEYASDDFYALLGYSKKEFDTVTESGNVSLTVYEDDREKFKEFLSRLSQNEHTEALEYRIVRKDGSIIYVSDTSESARSSDGIMYRYCTLFDITEKTHELAEAKETILEKDSHARQLMEELREARIKNSISQMQPHFLYNALASIREIILEDPQYASDLICDFTTHLRACVKSMSNNDLIPFRQELENIRAYVNIEKMRFGDKLKVQYEIDADDFMIVPLSIQPLVENSIRHGIYERGAKGGTVSIAASKTEEYYMITVKDDGVGFDYEKIRGEVERGERDSTGLSNLIFRLEKILGADVSVHSKIGDGTEITIQIPTENQSGGETV